MPYYNFEDTQKAAKFLASLDFTIFDTSQGDFTPEHVMYHCTLSYGGESFNTTYQSNPTVHGEPTVADVVAALASDATTAADYDIDDFADEFGFVTIESLQDDLDLGDYGDQCSDYGEDYITDRFHDVADENIDIYNYDLLQWLPDHYEWLEEADRGTDTPSLAETAKECRDSSTELAQAGQSHEQERDAGNVER